MTLEALRDDLNEVLKVERLEDVIADASRTNLINPPLTRCGQYDDMHVRVCFPNLINELVAVHVRHHQVEKNDVVGIAGFNPFQPSLTISSELNLELHPRQDRFEEYSDGDVIIDDENLPALSVHFQCDSLLLCRSSAGVITSNDPWGHRSKIPFVRRRVTSRFQQ